MEKFIETLKNDTSYDYIANNYYKMDKTELADIIKELLYAVYRNCTNAEYNQILQDMTEELEEKYLED